MDEPEELAKELIIVLSNRDDEINDFEHIEETMTQWQNHSEELNKRIKENILALTNILETEKEVYENESNQGGDALDKIGRELAASKSLEEKVINEIAALKLKLEDRTIQKESIIQENEKAKRQEKNELASHRYKLDLYSNVTNIRWDYSVGEDDVRGYIGNKDFVAPFQMNTKLNSRFFIANHLWDLMGSSISQS